MTTVRFSQNILGWGASESLSYLYGAAHMVLVVSPLCDATGFIFLSLLLSAMVIFAVYRVIKTDNWSLFMQFLPRTVGPTLRWGSGLAALAFVLKYVGFDGLEPEGLWPELFETLVYLAVMGSIMLLSITTIFSARYREVISTERLELSERRMLKLYLLVVLRVMLHKTETIDFFIAGFQGFTLFLTTFMWQFGFQPAKIE